MYPTNLVHLWSPCAKTLAVSFFPVHISAIVEVYIACLNKQVQSTNHVILSN